MASEPVAVEVMPEDLVPRAEIPRRWPVISKRMARRLTDDKRLPVWVIGARLHVSAADLEGSSRRAAVRHHLSYRDDPWPPGSTATRGDAAEFVDTMTTRSSALDNCSRSSDPGPARHRLGRNWNVY
ncbi:hypothetical protein [Frankia sp. AvcI1]|uniref:hypothetical protein n=1 Tax=Frankia sp. AvcI1 TaxID=573496 RepID=UPI002117994B|nr:hypothetical protein [Frankia sp. AvcI1]